MNFSTWSCELTVKLVGQWAFVSKGIIIWINLLQRYSPGYLCEFISLNNIQPSSFLPAQTPGEQNKYSQYSHNIPTKVSLSAIG